MGKCQSKLSCKNAVLLSAGRVRGKSSSPHTDETKDDIIVLPTQEAATKDNMLILVSGRDAAAIVAGVVDKDRPEKDCNEHSIVTDSSLEGRAQTPFPFCESIDNNSSLFFRSFSSAVSGAAGEDESQAQVTRVSSQDLSSQDGASFDTVSCESMGYTFKQFIVDVTTDFYIFLGILPDPKNANSKKERNLSYSDSAESDEDAVGDTSPSTNPVELDDDVSTKKVQFSTIVDVIDEPCMPYCTDLNSMSLNSIRNLISEVGKQNPQVPRMEVTWVEIFHRELARGHKGLLLADPTMQYSSIIPFTGKYQNSNIIPYTGAYEMTTKHPFYIWMDVSMFNQFAKENIDPFWFKETLTNAMKQQGLDICIKTPFEDPTSAQKRHVWGSHISSDRERPKEATEQSANYSAISA